MEILGKLGIDIKLLIAQIINFGLLLWLLKKFLYAPIIRRIEKDERTFDEAKIQTEKLKKEKEELTNELKAAREKAENIVAEAEAISKKIKEQTRKETKKEKEKVVQQIQSRLKDIENGQ